MRREDGGEVNGSRAAARKEGDVFISRLVSKRSMQASGKKSSKYHQEKKQTGNQNMCEQVRQEIICILGVIMYFPKRGEITPAEDAGIPGAIPPPPPLALYG